VGIEFNQDGARPERRQAPRAAVTLSASMRERGRSALGSRIESLSRLGCCVSGYGFVHPGGQVWVKLQGLESLSAHIVWCHEMRAGIAFDQPLHPAVLSRFVSNSHCTHGLPDTVMLTADNLPLHANDEPMSRREQIMQGIAVADRSPLVQRKAKSGAGIMDFITRQVVRQTNYRYEQRYSDPVSIGNAELRVAGCDAQVINVSPSGLRLAVEFKAQIGDEVSVEFAGFEVYPGRLVWLRDGEAGVSLPPNTIELSERA
jgi:hypothetical protein